MLSKPDANGTSARDSWQVHARRGRPDAIAMLQGPPFPFALEHLWRWHLELRQGRGIGMNGVDPLTWLTLDAWARWTTNRPTPEEVSALFQLDVVARNPELWSPNQEPTQVKSANTTKRVSFADRTGRT